MSAHNPDLARIIEENLLALPLARNVRCVTAGVGITLVLSSSIRSWPRCFEQPDPLNKQYRH